MRLVFGIHTDGFSSSNWLEDFPFPTVHCLLEVVDKGCIKKVKVHGVGSNEGGGERGMNSGGGESN